MQPAFLDQVPAQIADIASFIRTGGKNFMAAGHDLGTGDKALIPVSGKRPNPTDAGHIGAAAFWAGLTGGIILYDHTKLGPRFHLLIGFKTQAIDAVVERARADELIGFRKMISDGHLNGFPGGCTLNEC